MAFALALQSVHELPEGHGKTIFTTTTAIVVLTVLAYLFFAFIFLTTAHFSQRCGLVPFVVNLPVFLEKLS